MNEQVKVMIKGMVCERCISTVKQALADLDITLEEVTLGAITLPATTQQMDTALLEIKLKALGFSIVEDKRMKLVRDVKLLVKEVYSGNFDFKHRFRLSAFLAERLQLEYDIISNRFSDVEGVTIEKYVIDYRIERVKELLFVGAYSIADISFNLGFSSVAHLSRQFKEQTGLTLSYFKSIKQSWNLTGTIS